MIVWASEHARALAVPTYQFTGPSAMSVGPLA
jgi:hypothetical protein